MVCACHHKTKRLQLYQEAAAVGIALVPMFYLVSRTTALLNVDVWVGQNKQTLDLFVSGVLFHLLAEESGLNEWYLTNSHAAQKQLHTIANDNDTVHSDLDWLRTVESSYYH